MAAHHPDALATTQLDPTALTDTPIHAAATLDLDLLRASLEPGSDEHRPRGGGRPDPPSSTGDRGSPETCCPPCTTTFEALEQALAQQRLQTTALSRLLEEQSAALEALWEVVAALQERPPRPVPHDSGGIQS